MSKTRTARSSCQRCDGTKEVTVKAHSYTFGEGAKWKDTLTVPCLLCKPKTTPPTKSPLPNLFLPSTL